MQPEAANRGCLSFSRNQWIAVIVIALIIGTASWFNDATSTKYPVEVNLFISRATMIQGFDAFDGCDFTGHPFRIGISRDGDDSPDVREPLGRGYTTVDNDCRYTIRTEVEEASRYGVQFDNASHQFTDWFDADDVETTAESGGTNIVLDVSW